MSEAAAAEHRRAVSAVATLTDRQLRNLWRTVYGPDAAVVRDALMDTLPALGDSYGDMAGALGADYYDEIRARAEVRGRFVAEPAPLPGTSRYEALVRWGVDPLFSPDPDEALALAKLSGGLHRIVADVARQTVTDAAIRDPQSEGWRRVTSSDPCPFCRMLADRGAVYSDDTVRFASHDNCSCSAAPAFKPGRTVSVNQYAASKRNVTDADRARVRDYLRENY
jgi:hypothetical protein